MITRQARRTIAVVTRQLAAMGGDLFDIGLREEASGRMLPARTCSPAEITQPRFIAWLMHKNAGTRNGMSPSPWHIYIQPTGCNRYLTLIDDLCAGTIQMMQNTGFEPALIVETSPGNFQVWLKHDRQLIPAQGTLVAKDLARRFQGDPACAACKHYGRLANFTNPKPKYRDGGGRFPFVRLVAGNGQTYSSAKAYLDQILAPVLTPIASDQRPPYPSPSSASGPGRLPSLRAFHSSPRYLGDLHRADMAFALRAAALGAPSEWILQEILSARDLRKKGGPACQLAYATRTTQKAITVLKLCTPSRPQS